MTDGIFDEKPGAGDALPETYNAEEYVGEGKQFSDTAALLKSKLHGDAHISTIEAENAQLRERLIALAEKQPDIGNLEERLRQIAESRPAPDAGGTPPQAETPPEPTALDVSTVENIINDRLTQAQQEATKAQAVASVSAWLEEKTGSVEGAQAAVKKAAASLGVTVEGLRDQAAANPKVFQALVTPHISEPAPAAFSTPRSDVNTGAAQFAQTGEKRNVAWWNAQRKEKGNDWFFSDATQKARQEAIDAMGAEAFFAD